MIQLIINADDLGKDHDTNLAIEEALKERCITSSTIMANSTTWGDVHRIIDTYPYASFGVHLNLTEGKALTNSSILRENGIVDDNNLFTKVSRNITYASPSLEDAIFNEWDAQVSKIVNTEKVNITHVDGHHHIHMNTAYIMALKRLADKYHFAWIRRKHNSWCPEPFIGILKYCATEVILSLPMIKSLAIKKSAGLRGRSFNKEWIKEVSSITSMTDYFNGYEQALLFLQNGFFPKDYSIIELMCHPGHKDYEIEYSMVKSHEVEHFIDEVVLCSYKNVKR